jgi:hypothetical protein
LDKHQWTIRIDLSIDSTHYTQADGILESHGAAEGEHNLPLCQGAGISKLQEWQSG